MCCASTRERDEVRGVLQTKVRERERARVKFFCHWGEKELLRLKRSESSDLPAQSEVADRHRKISHWRKSAIQGVSESQHFQGAVMHWRVKSHWTEPGDSRQLARKK